MGEHGIIKNDGGYEPFSGAVKVTVNECLRLAILTEVKRRSKTVKIYKIMIGKRQINGVYHTEEDARVNAKQTAIDTGKPVTIWEIEEYEAVPGNLFWTRVGTYGLNGDE